MPPVLGSILIRIVIAGWVFYDAYGRKRYSKGPAIAWTLAALVQPILVLIFYLFFRLPQNWVLEKRTGKIDPEFVERKYRLQNNILMVTALIGCGVILYLLGAIVPTFSQMFQEIELTLPLLCKVESILGRWIWIIGILLMAGIIFFFKHPKLARFHRKHAPLSYVIYLIVMIIGLDILINSVVKNMYQPILEMSKIVK
jgi:hypothetical protein